MEYTVKKIARLAGVSSRTVRYYDEIGLLEPARVNSSGYRIYGPEEIDRLQQILFYRELGMKLDKIKTIITSDDFDELKALRQHRERLLEKKERLDLLLHNIEKTLTARERGMVMSDQEKFIGFKKKLIEENEQKYGREIREKYGEDAVKKSNEKVRNMSREEYDEAARLAEEVMETLEAAYVTGDPAGELAQKAADLHRRWLSYYWDSYSKEAHAGVAQLYVDDERFKAYYDKKQPGTAEFLKDAVFIYTGKEV